MASIQELFAARLRESEITDSVARYAGLSVLTADKVKRLYGSAPNQPAMRIPYFDPDGRDGGFYRLRLLGESAGGIVLEKPRRYTQPPHTGVRAYFPRVKGVNWMEVLSDSNIPLLITEGEMKALAATVSDFPCIGLGGVENWRSKEGPRLLLDELSAASWVERHVYIAYDSDVATKPQVMVAALRLADELASLGAHVYDAGLPVGRTSDKVGLDDYLRDNGPKALAEHLSAAKEFAHLRSLHEFNNRYVFIRASGRVYEPRTQESYEAAKFCSAVEVNSTYLLPKLDAEGNMKREKRYVAKDWMEWPQRRTVQQPTFVPGNDDLIVINGRGILELNRWPGWGVQPAKGDTSLWKTLFEHLTSNEDDREAIAWLERWLAYPLQHPGVKMTTAVNIWSAQQGTGKTLLGETILRIYGKNGVKIGNRQLQAPFNSWVAFRQLVMGDEITGSEQRQYADELKELITGRQILVNEKYEKELLLPNLANFYFTSNHPDAFFLDDNDRRFLVLEGPSKPLEPEFYKRYDAWVNEPSGPAALFHYLLNVDTKGFDPNGWAPRTRAHAVMAEDSRNDLGRYIVTVMRDPEAAEKLYGVPKSVDIFTVRELLRFFDPRGEKRGSERSVSVELQKQGARKLYNGEQVRVSGARERLYVVRNYLQWQKMPKNKLLAIVEKRQLPTPKF